MHKHVNFGLFYVVSCAKYFYMYCWDSTTFMLYGDIYSFCLKNLNYMQCIFDLTTNISVG